MPPSRFERIGSDVMVRFALPVAGAVALLAATGAPAQDAPARPGVDAPELAALGPHPVGVADVEFVQPGQADPLQGRERPAIVDRRLALKVWYPAAVSGRGTTYRSALPGENGKDVAFSVAGIASGLRNRDIGERLSISENTVKVHLHNIYEKVGVEGRMELLLLAQELKLV